MKKIICVLLSIFTLTLVLSGCAKSIVERGARDNVSYKNETIGITFNLPSGWIFYTDEEIAEAMDVSVDMLKDKDLIDSNKIKNIIEFIAVNTYNGNNINMAIEKLGLFNRGISVEKYIKKTKEQMKEQNASANYEFYDVEQANLGDVEFDRLKATTTYSGTNITQYMYIKKVGIHMVIITATTTNNLSPEKFESYFS